MNKKQIVGATIASALLFAPLIAQTTTVLADSFYANQTNAERADITNWVANTSEQISSNISAQHIDVNNLNQSDQNKYVIQWGDTLSGISAATGISVRQLAYDNNIRNIDLIYAGDTLMLNRDGYVPTDWYYYGDGWQVANTKVTINNFTENSDNSTHIDVSPVSVDDHSKTTNNYQSPADESSSGKTATGTSEADETDNDSTALSDSAATTSTSSTTKEADSTSSDKETNSTTTTNRLDEDEFGEAINDKLATKLDLDDETTDKLTVDFTAATDDDATTDTESNDDAESTVTDDDAAASDEDTDTDTEDNDTQTVYTEDQTITTNSTTLTTKNANKVAKKIYKQLKADDKLSDLDAADEIEVTVTATADGFDFNVTLTTEAAADNDSSESTTDADEASDSNTESESDSTSSEDEDSNDSVTTDSETTVNTTDVDE